MDVLFVKEEAKFKYETVAIASRRAVGAYPPQPVTNWASFTSKTVDATQVRRSVLFLQVLQWDVCALYVWDFL